jgi:dTDP-4-amino-4,6-dideoxygalactose transaminase
MAIAEKYDLMVVEDAAEAHGMLYKGKPAGTIGHLGAFSLYVAHIITTIEGGVITCHTDEHAEILRSLRSHGRACSCVSCKLSTEQVYCSKRFDPITGEDMRFTFPRIGYSCKMNELEAAVGLGNMNRYTDIVKTRHDNLKFVLDHFGKFQPYLSTIQEEAWETIGPHAIPIIINEEAGFTRSELTQYLEKNGIETRTLFQSMPTQCPGFSYLGYTEGQFPVAEYMGHNGIHIGCHHDLNIGHMEYFLHHVERFLSRYQS